MHNEAQLLAFSSTIVHSGPKEIFRMWTRVKLCKKVRGGIIKAELANNISRCLMRHRTYAARENVCRERLLCIQRR